MKSVLLSIILSLFYFSSAAQLVCDTCFDVNKRVTSIHFVNDSILAVAGNFDSLVQFNNPHALVNRQTGVIYNIPNFAGNIYSSAELDNGDLILRGVFRHHDQYGNMALVRNGVVHELNTINFQYAYSLIAIGNRVLIKQSSSHWLVSLPYSVEVDESVGKLGIGNVFRYRILDGFLYMKNYIWGDTWNWRKMNLTNFEISSWFDECTNCNYQPTPSANIVLLDSGRLLVEQLSNLFDSIPQPSVCKMLVDTNGKVLATKDSVYHSNGHIDSAGWNYLAKRFNGYWYYTSHTLQNAGVVQPQTLYVKNESTAQIDSATFTFNGVVSSIVSKDGVFIARGNFDTVNGIPAPKYVEIEYPGFQLRTYQAALTGVPNFEYAGIQSNYWIYNVEQWHESVTPTNGNFILLDVKNQQLVQSFTVNGNVNTMEIYGDTLLLGGIFDLVDGNTASNFAALDINQNAWIANVPVFDSAVRDIALIGDTIWVGGKFETANNSSRKGIALFNQSLNLLNDYPELAGSGEEIISIGFTKSVVALRGYFTAVNNYSATNGIILNRNNWSPIGFDTTRHGYNVDYLFNYLNAFGRNSTGEIMAFGGISNYTKSAQGSATSFFSAKDTLPITSSVHFNGDCDDDPFYSCGRVYSVEQDKHQTLVVSDWVNTAYGNKLNETERHGSVGIDFVYPDGNITPIKDINTARYYSVYQGNSAAVSSDFFAVGTRTELGQNMRQRNLRVGTKPVVPTTLLGSNNNKSICYDSTATVQLKVIQFVGDEASSISYGIVQGQDVVGKLDSVMNGDTITFYFSDFKKARTVLFEYAVSQPSYNKRSYFYELTVMPLPATPVLTLMNDTIVSSVDSLSHFWVTEAGPYWGWNLSTIPVNPAYNVYTAYAIGKNGCSSYMSNAISIVGANELTKSLVKVYPNPAETELIVHPENPETEVTLFGIDGKQYFNSILSQESKIDVSMLPKGIYMLVVSKEEIQNTQKIIIQ